VYHLLHVCHIHNEVKIKLPATEEFLADFLKFIVNNVENIKVFIRCTKRDYVE